MSAAEVNAALDAAALLKAEPPGSDKPHPFTVLGKYARQHFRLVSANGRPYAVPLPGADRRAVFGHPAGVALSWPAMQLVLVEAATSPALDLGTGPLTSATADGALLQLKPDAMRAPVALALRFHHDAAARLVVLDLGRRDGRAVTITPDGWTVGPVPAGVTFWRSHASRELPEPARDTGVTLAALADVLALDKAGEPFRLVLGWLAGLGFAAQVRPGLFVIGPYGSAKSTRLRLAASVVQPAAAEELLRSFGRKADDDEVSALHRAVPMWDNLSAVSVAASDLLATIITGASREGRKLYTDDDLSSAPIRRPAGLTAVAVPAGFQPDALDRLIITEPGAPASLRDDAEVQAMFDDVHAGLLAAWCDAVSAVLDWWPKVTAPGDLRMAAHARALAALDAATAAGDERAAGIPAGMLAAYRENVTATRQQAATSDVFGAAVLAMLAARPEVLVKGERVRQWSGTARELLAATAPYAGEATWKLPGWPSTPRGVPSTLGHLKAPLASVGAGWTTTPGRARSTRYDFMLVTQGDDK